jgi:phage head maturation protease
MSALAMQTALQRLFIRDGLTPKSFVAGLVDDPGAPVILSGLASTGDQDGEHCRFASRAFGDVSLARVPLLYDHDPDQVAGTVDDLHYDSDGRLVATVTAGHPLARRCSAFSIGARIRSYVIHDNGPGKFFAEITKAELTDLSLVPRPVNPQARVLSRRPPCPQAMFWELTRQRVACLQKLVNIIGATL